MKEKWKPGNMLYPLPAVMVTSKDKNKTNIITVAWAGTVSSDPAMVSISVRPERYSYNLIKENGEFVINLVTKELVKACDFSGVKSGRDIDKFKELNLHEETMSEIETKGIKESPVNIECKVTEVLDLGSHHMFLAKVIAIDIDSNLLDENNRFCLDKANLIAYSHGEYFLLGEKLGKFGFSVKKK